MALEAPYRPVEVSDVLLAFPASVKDLMPAEDAIPAEFWHWTSRSVKDAEGPEKWVAFQGKWFYEGLPPHITFDLKEGIDGNTAVRHLHAIQGSFEPKHEYKQAAVAFLASLWFNDVSY